MSSCFPDIKRYFCIANIMPAPKSDDAEQKKETNTLNLKLLPTIRQKKDQLKSWPFE